MTDELKHAISLIRSGEKTKGGQILANILKADPQNELAWLWMSQTVKTRQQQQDCLEKVLAINPGNKAAQKALTKIKQSSQKSVKGLPEFSPSTDPFIFKSGTSFQTEPKRAQPTPASVRKPKVPPKKRPPMGSAEMSKILMIAGGFVLMLLLVVAGGVLLLQNRQFEEDFAPMVDVCQKSRVSEAATYSRKTGIHPAVGVVWGSTGLELDNYYIPRSVRAQSVAETELVLCLGKTHSIYIGNCHYYDEDHPGVRKVVQRYYYQQNARLIVAKTGQVISQQSFTGKSARRCRDTEYFGSGERVKKLEGTSISSNDIKRWVEPQLIVE